MNKQLVAILLALAVGIGFSGAATAQNYGYSAQNAGGEQYTGYANQGMAMGMYNPLGLVSLYLIKALYILQLLMTGMPGGMMPMPGTTPTAPEGTETGGTQGAETGATAGTETGATQGTASESTQGTSSEANQGTATGAASSGATQGATGTY